MPKGYYQLFEKKLFSRVLPLSSGDVPESFEYLIEQQLEGIG
jgi:hypothetical protein